MDDKNSVKQTALYVLLGDIKKEKNLSGRQVLFGQTFWLDKGELDLFPSGML